MSSPLLESIDPLVFHHHHWAAGSRVDGRALHASRPVAQESAEIHTADGSCIVNIGNTKVLGGVKLHVTPWESSRKRTGWAEIRVEEAFQDSTSFVRSRRLSRSRRAYLSHWMGDVVARMGWIDETRMIAVKGKAVWVAYVDVYILEDDGNIQDALFLCIRRLLRHLRIPAVEWNEEKEEVSYMDGMEVEAELDSGASSSSKWGAVCRTFALVEDGHTFLSDPTEKEESLAIGSISVIVDVDPQRESKGHVCLLDLRCVGHVELSSEMLSQIVDEASKSSREIFSALN
eukprot:TRINITY_DN424_c0_g2_i1.p1 TRINITY_DN424_c0_g2~~TRINITY_DN424_c0_g2_i1.p1  ORF type:complete len:288 (+),score=79.05 TRINITY_DN424_c0_g2_i1:174-1037(+)